MLHKTLNSLSLRGLFCFAGGNCELIKFGHLEAVDLIYRYFNYAKLITQLYISVRVFLRFDVLQTFQEAAERLAPSCARIFTKIPGIELKAKTSASVKYPSDVHPSRTRILI